MRPINLRLQTGAHSPKGGSWQFVFHLFLFVFRRPRYTYLTPSPRFNMILTDDKSTEAQQNSHPTEQAPPAYEEIQPASSRNRQRTPVSPRSQAHAGPSSFFVSNPEPRPLQHSTSYPPTSQYSAGSSSYAPSSAQLSSSSGNALYLGLTINQFPSANKLLLISQFIQLAANMLLDPQSPFLTDD